jgi:hypothetical protein
MVKVSSESVRPDSVGVEFDDERLIANAGLVLVATLSKRLGLEQMSTGRSAWENGRAPPAQAARCSS